MDRIPRTNDRTLDALIERVERFYGTPVRQSEINQYVTPPILHYLALSHLEYTTSRVEARAGALTDDTLLNPRFPDKIINCQARVGTEAGQGIGYHQDLVTFRHKPDSLPQRINIILDEAFAAAADSYDNYVSASRRDTAI